MTVRITLELSTDETRALAWRMGRVTTRECPDLANVPAGFVRDYLTRTVWAQVESDLCDYLDTRKGGNE